MTSHSDFLVLGSGIAGFSAALELSELGSVTVVTKGEPTASNSQHAQGGIAAVMDETDSFQDHVQDTLTAGAGLCDEKIVRTVVAEGPGRIRKLIGIGVRFSGTRGKLDLGLEGGHSKRRILHSEDLTGREIQRALSAACREAPNIHILEDHAAVDLIVARHPSDSTPDANRCLGAYILNSSSGRVGSFTAKTTILATGGAGKVYLYTSNPDIASGDGMAMAYRAGCELKNLEFVQFHPTCLYNPAESQEEGRRYLLSEALRGEGGRLILGDGTRFMQRYDKRLELAPRDIVARAIDTEMKKTGDKCVYLDMSARDRGFLLSRFPNIYGHCQRIGIDIAHDPIPVVPAAHFFCGGVSTDSWGATALPGLYAIGEVAHTGLHGANRLASNSLLEGSVFAHRAFERIRETWPDVRNRPIPAVPPWDTGQAVEPDEAVMIGQNWDDLRRLMWNYVGIVRADKRLNSALRRIKLIGKEVSDYYWKFLLTRDLIELRNIALLSELIVTSALSRKESRGLHFNKDYPSASPTASDSAVSRYLAGVKDLGNQEAARL